MWATSCQLLPRPFSAAQALRLALVAPTPAALRPLILAACPPLLPLQALRLALVAPSLGGVETLAGRPAVMSHAGLTPEQREAAGISEGLVRVAVGVEDTGDVVADFERALRVLEGCGV